MKKALLTALATAATAITLSSGAAFADTTSSTWRPHGSAGPKVYRYNKPHRHVHVAPRVVVRPPTPVEISAANLAALKRVIYSDGRVTFIEKIKLSAAERRHAALVRSYY
jgi:hypothetical protein